MADCFSQIHIQLVFAVKYRDGLILSDWKEDLHRYITGILQQKGHKMLQINSVADHIHLFLGFRPNACLSELVKVLKVESANQVQAKGWAKQFAWQGGYGAFSYSKWDVPKIIQYIARQEEHHRRISFNDEYRALLQEQGLAFREEHLFGPLV